MFVIAIILAETNINGALRKVHATIALAIYENTCKIFGIVDVRLLTKSISKAYCVAKTKTVGAEGNVPYKKP